MPKERWEWEVCDIPVCELNCTRPGFDEDLPPCRAYTEPNPSLQATVSLFSGSDCSIIFALWNSARI